jgi:hypothetical protein
MELDNNIDENDLIHLKNGLNKKVINIEDNNKDIPLKINISPSYSNIIQYTNINNINKSFCLTSNGFINIGSINPINNQLNIFKNNNDNTLNTDLISLNINNINYISSTGPIEIPFIINDNINEFIIRFSNSIITGDINITIILTNSFIENNISSIIYDNDIYYKTNETNLNNSSTSTTSTSSIFSENIKHIIKYPSNFIIDIYGPRIEDTFKFQIYNNGIAKPNITNENHYKIVEFYYLNSGKKLTYEFYIYKYNYKYNYNGSYYPKKTNFISALSNNITRFSMSEYGNIGIGYLKIQML